MLESTFISVPGQLQWTKSGILACLWCGIAHVELLMLSHSTSSNKRTMWHMIVRTTGECFMPITPGKKLSSSLLKGDCITWIWGIWRIRLYYWGPMETPQVGTTQQAAIHQKELKGLYSAWYLKVIHACRLQATVRSPLAGNFHKIVSHKLLNNCHL